MFGTFGNFCKSFFTFRQRVILMLLFYLRSGDRLKTAIELKEYYRIIGLIRY
jgi:hypothetical protein